MPKPKMLKIYQFITTAALPLIGLYLLRRRMRGKEDVIRFSERFGYPGKPRPEGKLVWIHAASVGESLSVLPLIQKLSAKYKNANFMITTGTVSSAKMIEQRLPERTFHQYIPVDSPICVNRFLAHWQPDLALWVESELWPNLVYQASRHCPLVMINGRISDGSYAKWQKYKSLGNEVLGCFTLCLAQAQHDAERLRNIGAKNVKYSGNIKYDTPTLAADPQKLGEIQETSAARPVWVAASTHGVEEKIVASVHKSLKDKHKGLLTIIAPRHPKRKDEILASIAGMGLEIAVRSNGDKITSSTDIYLADTMGELGIFYRVAEIVFIGGSLVEHGGQNPLEPARLSNAIIVGPHTFNFIEIQKEFIEKEAILTVQDEVGLCNAVDELLIDNTKRAKLITAANNLVLEKNGIIDNVIKDIEGFME